MAREPFSSNADSSGFSGVSGYNTTDARSPSLGRSSRDLVADTGPGAANENAFTTPDTDTQTTTGTGRDRTDSVERSLRDRKANPDADPDTRMGLRPATAGLVAPRLPAYPTTGAGARAGVGAIAGLIGGATATAAWYAAFWAGAAALPPSLAAARTVAAGNGAAVAVGILGSLVAAAVWGALFGLLVRKPTVLKGMAFGLLPAVFQWLVLAPLSHRPLFFGATAAAILLPILFCVLLWGGITGYYAGRWLRPPYSAAVDPDITSPAA